jgi:hypothetical protein
VISIESEGIDRREAGEKSARYWYKRII